MARRRSKCPICGRRPMAKYRNNAQKYTKSVRMRLPTYLALKQLSSVENRDLTDLLEQAVVLLAKELGRALERQLPLML